MKRMLALILSLMLLFSSTALADGVAMSVENVKLNMMGKTITLSDLNALIAYAQQDDVTGIDMNLLYKGESFADLVMAKDGDYLILAGDALSHDYSLDLKVIVPIIKQLVPAEALAQAENAAKGDAKPTMNIPFDEADVEALLKLWESWSKHLETAITDLGSEEKEGVTVQTYGFAFTAEMVDELVQGLCGILDNHPDLVKELTAGSDAKSVTELYKAADLSLRTEGTLTLSGTHIVLDADLYAAAGEQAEKRTHVTLGLTEGEEEVGAKTAVGLDVFVSTFDEADALVDQVNAGLTVTMDTKSNELCSMEGNLSLKATDTEADLTLTMLLCAPSTQEDGLWHLTITDKPETAALTAAWGEKDEKAVFEAVLTEKDGAKMELSFNEKAEKTGAFRFTMATADGEVTAEWDAAMSEVEAADWLPKMGADTLDLLTLTEEQMTELQTELSLLSANVVLGVAGTSEELMQMLNEMETPEEAAQGN